jgi:hypothetical protein
MPKESVMKKSYIRPQLVKHGNVEALTLGVVYGGPSDCILGTL